MSVDNCLRRLRQATSTDNTRNQEFDRPPASTIVGSLSGSSFRLRVRTKWRPAVWVPYFDGAVEERAGKTLIRGRWQLDLLGLWLLVVYLTSTLALTCMLITAVVLQAFTGPDSAGGELRLGAKETAYGVLILALWPAAWLMGRSLDHDAQSRVIGFVEATLLGERLP